MTDDSAYRGIAIACINCGLWSKIAMTKGLCLNSGAITDHAATCKDFISKSDFQAKIAEASKKKIP